VRRSGAACRADGAPGRREEQRVIQEKTGNGTPWQDVRVSLGPDAEVTGKLSFATPTRIEGKLKGEVRASDLLVVGPQAVIQATVRAVKLVVLGEVRGEVQGATRVQICSGGRLFADVETNCLVVEEGATFEGRSRMGQDSAAASPPPS
jgi:cytoskeletal protein CcmA (bactofilin family)